MYYRPGPLVQTYYCYRIVKFSRFAQQRVYRSLPPRYNLGVKQTTAMTTTVFTPDSTAIHAFLFDSDTQEVTVTFRYNLDKKYSFAVNQATTVGAIQNLIEAADSKGKMLAELRKEGMLVAI